MKISTKIKSGIKPHKNYSKSCIKSINKSTHFTTIIGSITEHHSYSDPKKYSPISTHLTKTNFIKLTYNWKIPKVKKIIKHLKELSIKIQFKYKNFNQNLSKNKSRKIKSLITKSNNQSKESKPKLHQNPSNKNQKHPK